MKPAIRDNPIHACGSLSVCADSACLRIKRFGSSWFSGSAVPNVGGGGGRGSGIGMCAGRLAALLYSVSIPSGITIIMQVPISRPVPMLEMTRE